MTTNGYFVLRVSKKLDLLLVLVVEGGGKKYVLFDSTKTTDGDGFVEVDEPVAAEVARGETDGRGFVDVPSKPFASLDDLLTWVKKQLSSEIEAIVRMHVQDIPTDEILGRLAGNG